MRLIDVDVPGFQPARGSNNTTIFELVLELKVSRLFPKRRNMLECHC